MENDEPPFNLKVACTALLKLCVKSMRSFDVARAHLKPIPLGLTSLANEVFALHQVLARVGRSDLQKLSLLETARGQHVRDSFEPCFLGCKITISAVNELAEELRQAFPLVIADRAGASIQPNDELQQLWKQDHVKEFTVQLQEYRNGLTELLTDTWSEYHEREEPSIDNERSAASDLVNVEASYQPRPSSIRSSNQGSLLDPSPPYALSLHEYQTDHVYSATTERVTTTTQRIVETTRDTNELTRIISLSGSQEPWLVRICVMESVMESCTLTAKTVIESINISSIAQIRLGSVKREIDIALNTQQNTYLNLPLAEPWLLEIVCWHVINGREKHTFGNFELNLADCIWIGGVHMPPAWYTLKKPSWNSEFGFRESKRAGKVKLQLTVLDPADKATGPNEILKQASKLSETTAESSTVECEECRKMVL